VPTVVTSGAVTISIPDFSKASVLVVGDVMLDRYLFGGTSRISPEAPVQVVAVKDKEFALGGSGNVVNNLATLGAEVFASPTMSRTLVAANPRSANSRSAASRMTSRVPVLRCAGSTRDIRSLGKPASASP